MQVQRVTIHPMTTSITPVSVPMSAKEVAFAAAANRLNASSQGDHDRKNTGWALTQLHSKIILLCLIWMHSRNDTHFTLRR